MYFLPDYNSEINEIEGVTQIKIDVPFAVHYVSVYLFKAGGKYVLFDAGLNMGNWKKKFFDALNKIGVSIKEIDYCFISHEHLDHQGLANAFKRKNPNIKIQMHDITHEMLQWESDKNNMEYIEKEAKELAELMIKYGITEEQATKLIQWFTMWPRYRKYVEPDVILHDGDTISIGDDTLEVIWTPGHSLGHICIFDRASQYLYAGDHILSRITPHIGNFSISPKIQANYADQDFHNILKRYLESLDRIDALNPKIIFPAHQEIIFNPHKRIEEIKAHHDRRLKEISDVIKDHPTTPLDISFAHFGDELDDINRYLAISEVLGHLIFLEERGQVKRIEENGKILFES